MDQIQSSQAGTDVNSLILRAIRLLKKARWAMAATGLLAIVAANLVLARYVPDKFVSQATILVVDPQLSPSIVTPVSTTTAVDVLEVAAQEVLSESHLLTIAEESGLVPPGVPQDV